MAKPYILYLRPFLSDGAVLVPNPDKAALMYNLMPTSSHGTVSEIGVEELLLKSSNGRGFLIGIGRVSEIVGAGKVIASDAEWENSFMTLAHKAECIISVPSLHPSTKWELKWLAEQAYFSRVLMILTDIHFSGRKVMHCDIRQVRAGLASVGWSIPENVTAGTLINFNEDGFALTVAADTKYKVKALRKMLDSTIANGKKHRTGNEYGEA